MKNFNPLPEFPFFSDEPEAFPEDQTDLPDFSLREALTEYKGEITPDDFLRMAKAEMQRVFGEEPEIDPESEIPPRSEGEADFEWLIRRNLILMVRYLNSQIDSHADPERVRDDLIAIDRFLNTYLLSQDLDAEDGYSGLTEYFEEDLMRLDPLPPFTPLFGSFARFYAWMKDEPELQDQTNCEEIAVPRACEMGLLTLTGDIPYLTRLYEIASDPANAHPFPASGKSVQTEESPAEVRVSNWRAEQRDQNRQIVSRFRRELQKNGDWKREEIDYAVQIADLYLVNTLPMLLLRADQSAYDLRATIRRARRSLNRSGRTEDAACLSKSISALKNMLTGLGLLPPESSAKPLDPYYPEILDRAETDIESLATSWPVDQAPDEYEDNLNWLKWNIERNARFLLAFSTDLEDSGMSADRILEHVYNVQELMGELLQHQGRTMETMPEGLNDLLDPDLDIDLDDCDFMTDPDTLRRSVASLRRFYRSMVKKGYLSKDVGDELLSYLKQQTRGWMEYL